MKKVMIILIIVLLNLIVYESVYANEDNVVITEYNLKNNKTITQNINSIYNKKIHKQSKIEAYNPISNNLENLLFRTVFPPDYRTPVSDSNKYPFCCIGYLHIMFPNGEGARGTAFLIDENIALTAGHCLYSPQNGGKATTLYFYPARNGNIRPYVAEVTAYVLLKEFEESPNYENDWGILILDKDIGSSTGWIGANSYEDYALQDKGVRITGYPELKPNVFPEQLTYDQWEMAGNVDLVENGYIGYRIDTYAGQRGSPVYERIDNLPYAVGIHNNGKPQNSNIELNYGARITKDLIDWCLYYIDKY